MTHSTSHSNMQTATFGMGCFWCSEAFFSALAGVEKVQSGFSGGDIKNPSYREVCSGRTGHAEVVQITFNREVIGFEALLEVFFKMHDPTTLNRQGNDVGTQYRSVIFYHNPQQKTLAQQAVKAANQSGEWHDEIVTQVVAFEAYFPAESNHDDFFANHPEQPYCRAVIRPKMDKFRSKFSELLRSESEP